MNNRIKNKTTNMTKRSGSFVSTISNINKPIIVACVFIVFILTLFVVLYQPAKEYYKSVREHDKLQAQYDAIKKTNDELNEDIENLQTEDGIKQKAADTLGLISAGESIGYVSGDNVNDGRENSAASTSSKLAYKNIKTPVT